MTRLEHVAFWVRDLDAMCAFYADTFGAAVGPLYENTKKGFASRFLTLESGARLELMRTCTLNPVEHEPGAQRMGLTHIALALGSEAAVDALTTRLRAKGVDVLDGPRRTGDGYYESVVLDPEGKPPRTHGVDRPRSLLRAAADCAANGIRAPRVRCLPVRASQERAGGPGCAWNCAFAMTTVSRGGQTCC